MYGHFSICFSLHFIHRKHGDNCRVIQGFLYMLPLLKNSCISLAKAVTKARANKPQSLSISAVALSSSTFLECYKSFHLLKNPWPPKECSMLCIINKYLILHLSSYDAYSKLVPITIVEYLGKLLPHDRKCHSDTKDGILELRNWGLLLQNLLWG